MDELGRRPKQPESSLERRAEQPRVASTAPTLCFHSRSDGADASIHPTNRLGIFQNGHKTTLTSRRSDKCEHIKHMRARLVPHTHRRAGFCASEGAGPVIFRMFSACAPPCWLLSVRPCHPPTPTNTPTDLIRHRFLEQTAARVEIYVNIWRGTAALKSIRAGSDAELRPSDYFQFICKSKH